MSKIKSLILALLLAVAFSTVMFGVMWLVFVVLKEFGAWGFWVMVVVGLTAWIYKDL